jgi:hypothetical protein
MIRRRAISPALLAVGLLAAAPCAGAAGKPSGTVPGGWLRGRTLLVHGGEATVVAPGAFWKWTSMERGGGFLVFICANQMDRRSQYVFAVSDGVAKTLSPSHMDEEVQELKSMLNVGGSIVARPSYESCDVPFPGSYRLRFEEVTAAGTIYYFGYMGLKGRLYATMCVSLSPEEPREFTKFASSVAARPVPQVSSGAVVVWALAVVGGVVLWWRKSRTD